MQSQSIDYAIRALAAGVSLACAGYLVYTIFHRSKLDKKIEEFAAEREKIKAQGEYLAANTREARIKTLLGLPPEISLTVIEKQREFLKAKVKELNEAEALIAQRAIRDGLRPRKDQLQ